MKLPPPLPQSHTHTQGNYSALTNRPKQQSWFSPSPPKRNALLAKVNAYLEKANQSGTQGSNSCDSKSHPQQGDTTSPLPQFNNQEVVELLFGKQTCQPQNPVIYELLFSPTASVKTSGTTKCSNEEEATIKRKESLCALFEDIKRNSLPLMEDATKQTEATNTLEYAIKIIKYQIEMLQSCTTITHHEQLKPHIYYLLDTIASLERDSKGMKPINKYHALVDNSVGLTAYSASFQSASLAKSMLASSHHPLQAAITNLLILTIGSEAYAMSYYNMLRGVPIKHHEIIKMLKNSILFMLERYYKLGGTLESAEIHGINKFLKIKRGSLLNMFFVRRTDSYIQFKQIQKSGLDSTPSTTRVTINNQRQAVCNDATTKETCSNTVSNVNTKTTNTKNISSFHLQHILRSHLTSKHYSDIGRLLNEVDAVTKRRLIKMTFKLSVGFMPPRKFRGTLLQHLLYQASMMHKQSSKNNNQHEDTLFASEGKSTEKALRELITSLNSIITTQLDTDFGALDATSSTQTTPETCSATLQNKDTISQSDAQDLHSLIHKLRDGTYKDILLALKQLNFHNKHDTLVNLQYITVLIAGNKRLAEHERNKLFELLRIELAQKDNGKFAGIRIRTDSLMARLIIGSSAAISLSATSFATLVINTQQSKSIENLIPAITKSGGGFVFAFLHSMADGFETTNTTTFKSIELLLNEHTITTTQNFLASTNSGNDSSGALCVPTTSYATKQQDLTLLASGSQSTHNHNTANLSTPPQTSNNSTLAAQANIIYKLLNTNNLANIHARLENLDKTECYILLTTTFQFTNNLSERVMPKNVMLLHSLVHTIMRAKNNAKRLSTNNNQQGTTNDNDPIKKLENLLFNIFKEFIQQSKLQHEEVNDFKKLLANPSFLHNNYGVNVNGNANQAYVEFHLLVAMIEMDNDKARQQEKLMALSLAIFHAKNDTSSPWRALRARTNSARIMTRSITIGILKLFLQFTSLLISGLLPLPVINIAAAIAIPVLLVAGGIVNVLYVMLDGIAHVNTKQYQQAKNVLHALLSQQEHQQTQVTPLPDSYGYHPLFNPLRDLIPGLRRQLNSTNTQESTYNTNTDNSNHLTVIEPTTSIATTAAAIQQTAYTMEQQFVEATIIEQDAFCFDKYTAGAALQKTVEAIMQKDATDFNKAAGLNHLIKKFKQMECEMARILMLERDLVSKRYFFIPDFLAGATNAIPLVLGLPSLKMTLAKQSLIDFCAVGAVSVPYFSLFFYNKKHGHTTSAQQATIYLEYNYRLLHATKTAHAVTNSSNEQRAVATNSAANNTDCNYLAVKQGDDGWEGGELEPTFVDYSGF